MIAFCFGSNLFIPVKVASQSNQIFISQRSDREIVQKMQKVEQMLQILKLIEQAQKLLKEGKYNEGTSLVQEATTMAKKIWGEKEVSTAAFLSTVGATYFEQRYYKQAETFFLESLAIRKEILGGKHLITASSLSELASLYRVQRKYQDAEKFSIESLAIRKEILGEKHPDTIKSVEHLAKIYYEQGNFKKAEILFLQCLAFREEVLGEKHTDTINSIDNLAILYETQGDYQKAERLYLQSLRIRKEIFGEKHPDIITSMENLAGLYNRQGNYQEAKNLFNESLAISREILDKEDQNTANTLNNLANFYYRQGNYQEAETFQIQSLEVRKKILGEKHPLTAESLYNLAKIYEGKKDYKKAETLYLQSLVIRKEVLGEEDPQTFSSFDSLAQLYYRQKNYKEAEIFALQSLTLQKDILGEKHPDVANNLQFLANLYYIQGNSKKAETLNLQSLAIDQEIFGKKHPTTADSLGNLSVLYWAEDKYTLALDYLTQSTDIEEEYLTEFLNNIGDESRKQAYINTLSGSTNVTISLHLNAQPDNPEASQLAFTTILRRKGRILDALSEIVAVLRQNSNPKTEALFSNLAQKRNQLSSLTYQGIENRTPEVYKNLIATLETEIKDIETNLSNQSAEFRTINQPITLEAVQKAIPKDTALVEYMVYQPYNPKNRELGKPRYAVYILHPDRTPQGIDLGETEKIDNLALLFRAYLGGMQNQIVDDSYLKELEKTSQEIYTLIFEPLLPLLNDKTNLFISPDSQLNLIPFVALQNRQGKYLLKDYSINYLSSGRDLLRLQNEFKPQSPPVIVANPTYNLDIDRSLMASANYKTRGATRAGDLTRLGCCNALPGTKAEAEAIIPLLSNAIVYTENQALVENVIKVKAPKILHLATHGFFLPDEEKKAPSNLTDSWTNMPINAKSENPLLRSGLAFAGFSPKNKKMDGALTALDVSSIYLWGTKLVVLSACETGLGDVRNGEGVYGLRRAFVLAGAQSQLMTLWEVSDDATKELMSNYYKKLNQGEGRADALRQVQLEMLNSEQYNNPYFWAGFIPSGDWRSLD